jgi:transcriptional regulator with XRE-family HTH domain
MARTPKAQALGAELRRAREQSGLTTRELANRIGRNQGEISRWETGDRTPKPEHVAQFLTALGIIGDSYEEVMSLTHDTTAPLWVATTLPAQRQQLAAYVEIEQSAVAITEVLPGLIPGLLQTRAYAHAIMSGGNLSLDEITTRVAIRMGRRDAIDRTDPVQYSAFIGEAAIHQTVGDRSTMIEQFGYLLEKMRLPNVTVRVMPLDSGWHPGVEGSFIIMLPANLTPIVHLELRRTTLFLHEEDDVNAYKEALNKIHKVSLTPEASARLITDRMENLS